jgi:hypothetical protein
VVDVDPEDVDVADVDLLEDVVEWAVDPEWQVSLPSNSTNKHAMLVDLLLHKVVLEACNNLLPRDNLHPMSSSPLPHLPALLPNSKRT